MPTIVTRLKSELKYRLKIKLGRVGARRYIHPKLGVSGFFSQINNESINYSVLRWFDSLPHIDPGEDIDLLVDDLDLPRITKYLVGTPWDGIPCDIYSTSGLPGSCYAGISYFVPTLAKEILDNSTIKENGVRSPSCALYLISLIYHVLYHKGYKAGLPVDTNHGAMFHNADHAYDSMLANLSEKSGMELPSLNMSELSGWMEKERWCPPLDTLEKLAAKNNWIRDTFFTRESLEYADYHGLTVFVVREQGRRFIDDIKRILNEDGFHTLHEEALDKSAVIEFAASVRGGNWGKGPWAKSGGLPAFIFVMFDLFPELPDSRLRKDHVGLTNARSYMSKIRVRDFINDALPPADRFNVVHSSDNARQALHYITLLDSAKISLPDLFTAIALMRESVRIDYPVKKILPSNRRRSIVRQIDYYGDSVVCKTYVPGCSRFLENEVMARNIAVKYNISGLIPVIHIENNSLFFPFYPGANASDGFLSPGCILAIKKMIVEFRRQGYELIDFGPHNIIRSDGGEILFHDFEFMLESRKNSSLEQCFCLYGLPAEWDGKTDLPVGIKLGDDSHYKRTWAKSTGIPRWVLVHSNTRALYFLMQMTYGNYVRFCGLVGKKMNAIFSPDSIRWFKGVCKRI